MASSGLKFFALLALLMLSVTSASSNPSRQLRVEQPPARHLQGKMGWWAVVKTNLAYQPINDKVYQKLKQIKERVLDRDT
ncbi:hypothetical protein PF005_g20669 [Phytophthora fragariae]|uniref:RxLR effector protein n=2 Tax=Phytophthora TaxID=4783 RepID=A0A6A3FNU3_9STRA|nr:hypothetical protein PF003_g27552 [Phytophthora fragariae]KAE8964478.1 hypothetical protein PR002_g28965 [Phytophthora rubi]KAE8943438.1 hypothetical protein PF009_g6854 [Phytophthora fragariae]KAE8965551.1 hypothetical protein PR001_g28691 [Phytophthora rubi]KAE8987727.1 hypothetical protein PF011_g19465 [Phytophthora fragariae]